MLNFLNESSDSKFTTRNWNIFNDQSKANFSVENEIIYSTEVLKSNLCNYNDAYILVRGNVSIIDHNVAQVAFKICPPFNKRITKINETAIDHAEDLDLVMLMYNLQDYNSNYSDTTDSWWFHSTDETTNLSNDIANTNNFKSFKYKTKFFGNTKADGANGILRNTEITVPLSYISSLWRSLEMPLISWKVEFKLKWTKHCFVCSWCWQW